MLPRNSFQYSRSSLKISPAQVLLSNATASRVEEACSSPVDSCGKEFLRETKHINPLPSLQIAVVVVMRNTGNIRHGMAAEPYKARLV